MADASFLVFVMATALLVMSPGPNGVLIARIVPTSGASAGFAAIAGFFAAFYMHGALSVMGVSLIIMQSAVAFSVIKLLGAAYLIWIGLKALIAAWRNDTAPATIEPARRARDIRWAFAEGFATNALNPKVSMFYLAVFPQFIPQGDNPVATALGLVTVHAAINVAWFTTMVLLMARATRALRGPGFQRWLKATTGVVFVGFGIKLATLRAA